MRTLAARLLRGLARRIEPPNQWAFLDARQAELGGVEPINFAALIRAYVAARGTCLFVQIGAHTGDPGDPVARCIKELRLPGILVEPQAAEFAALQANYADQPQLVFERAAIAAADGEATLYKVRPEFWREHGFPEHVTTQISSLDRAQIGRTVEIFGGATLRADETAYLATESVPALTLRTLLDRHGVEHLDLLQIDAEGFDYEILKMLDWATAPPLIHYETVNLAVPDRIAAWELLRTHGYALCATDVYNTLAIRVGHTPKLSR